MKTFKQHLDEHSGHFSRQWLDQDTIPSAPHALEALNSLIGQMAEQEYLNPKVGIEKLQVQLGKLNYHFESPTAPTKAFNASTAVSADGIASWSCHCC